jgi:hypothetical protein
MSRRKRNADPQRTHVVIVQDRSGSMGDRTQATIDGFNEYKNGVAKDAEGEVLLTLVQFDHEISNVWVGKPIAEVPDLSEEMYQPRGSTRLNDAVMQGVADAKPRVRKGDSVILVIMTDGYENASQEFGGVTGNEKVRAELDRRRKDGWDVLFLGAGEQSWDTGAAFGIAAAQSLSYGSGSHAHEGAYMALASSTVTKTRSPLRVANFAPEVKSAVENDDS